MRLAAPLAETEPHHDWPHPTEADCHDDCHQDWPHPVEAACHDRAGGYADDEATPVFQFFHTSTVFVRSVTPAGANSSLK